jgi:molecular chaperone GrpE
VSSFWEGLTFGFGLYIIGCMEEEKNKKQEEKPTSTKATAGNEENKEQEYLESWKRERAAFLNYKKEELERMKKVIKFANEELILKVLDILDNIYIAEKELPKELENNQWVEGVLKIKNQIIDFLKKQGVEEIEALGKKFNPCFHEASAFVEASADKPETIIEEIKKGYLLHGKVIRPAKVKISK